MNSVTRPNHRWSIKNSNDSPKQPNYIQDLIDGYGIWYTGGFSQLKRITTFIIPKKEDIFLVTTINTEQNISSAFN